MNQINPMAKRPAAEIPTPSPAFAPVLNPFEGGVEAIAEDADVDAGAEAMELSWVDVELSWVVPVVIVVELLALGLGLTISLLEMLK